MPFTDEGYEKLTEEEIFTRLENQLQDKLGASAQPGELVTSQLRAEAKTLAENQEKALERVYNSAFLEDADGKELDKLVDIIGLSRSLSTAATGTVRLSRKTPPAATYTIPSGSVVQTAGSDVKEYEITEKDSLRYLDGFEAGDLNNWTGDKSDFSVLTTTEMTGQNALEVPAKSGVQLTSTVESMGIGTTFTTSIKPQSGSITAFRFGLQDQSNYFELEVDTNSDDLTLNLIEGGSTASTSTNDTPAIPVDTRSYVEMRWSLYGDIEAKVYDNKERDAEIASVSLSASREWTPGAYSIASLDATATALVDKVTTREVVCDIESVIEGVETNIGPKTITVLKSNIPGVESVNNPKATGNPQFSHTDYTPFVPGEKEETDEELRQRAFDNTSIGGSASVNAINTELQRVDGVKSVTIKRNREETSVDGLPAHSFEAIVYGGDDKDVANTIFDTASIDSTDYGGAHGQGVSYDITSDVTKSSETINWSRPTKLNLNIDLTLIVDDTYVGDSEIQSLIVEYVGGNNIDGSFTAGLNVGEDVYLAVLKRNIVSPEKTGVWEVDSITIDSNNDGNDDTTIKTNGAEVLSVSDSEVPITNARDGSISITTTQK